MKLLKSKKTITWFIAILTVFISLTAFLTIIAYPSKHANAATDIGAPTVDIVTYNCAVAFNWKVGKGGDELYSAGMNGKYFSSVGSATYADIAFPTTGYRNCSPTYKYWKSYSASTQTFSSESSTLAAIDFGDHIQTTFDRNCRYTVKDQFKNWQVGPSSHLATDYGKDSMLKWAHGGKNKATIKATVSYDGMIADFQVTVPLLGYHYSKISLGSYQFEMRTGPKYLYLKTLNSGVFSSRVWFAFAVV